MKLHVPALLTLCFVVGACSDPTPKPPSASAPSAAAPLTSWNPGAARSAIVDFVERTTRQGTPDFVPQAERIAVFDNDGTLWAEQPMYFQLAFALDRIRALAPEHQEWKTTQPFKGALEGDVNSVLAGGEHSVLQIVAASHSGNTSEEFEATVAKWIGSARHPVTKRPYVEMVYQPMLEVLTYLRANGYKTFIVSGGGVEFMRPWVERVYGVPPEQVVGSRVKVKYEVRESGPVLVRLPEIDFIDDKAGWHSTGHRPPPHGRLRQFRRRLRNARVDDQREGAAPRRHRSSHRRRTRVGVRPRFPHRATRARSG